MCTRFGRTEMIRLKSFTKPKLAFEFWQQSIGIFGTPIASGDYCSSVKSVFTLEEMGQEGTLIPR